MCKRAKLDKVQVINKTIQILNKKERHGGALLLILVLIMALFQTAGVASIIPFINVLGNPEVVETNRWLALMYNELEFANYRSFLVFLGFAVFGVLVSSIIIKALTQWVMLRYTNMLNHNLSCRLFQAYLKRQYIWFLNQHSADLGTKILSEVMVVVNRVVMPMIQLFVNFCVAFFLIVLLIVIDPVLAGIVAAILCSVYAMIYIAVRKYLGKIGAYRVVANKERFEAAQEALGGIKEVKIFQREAAFLAKFSDPSYRFAQYQVNSQIVALMPKFVLEIIAFGGMLLISVFLFLTYGEFSQVFPILAVYALAGYRLLPALQNVYNQLSNLRFGAAALETLYVDILESEKNTLPYKADRLERIRLHDKIQLMNITFTYPGAPFPAIEGLSMEIPVKSTVGLIGATGASKTTTVDIILGLLNPTCGELLIDGNPITSLNIHSWQKNIGYVPQQIFLSDDSIASNIAFGITYDEIDMEAVIKAAKIAELHDFVIQDLPNGYDTLVGERGVRLSGGQRQRIGIARALYHDPDVLVFDEATSALDNHTEKAVMNSIHNLGRTKTIVLIAHRLTTVEDCDLIYLLERGKIKAKGKYQDLSQYNN